MKKFTLLILGILLLGTLVACDDGKDYTCGYCGREMEHYFDYVGGEYTCYSCSKAIRD